MEELLSQATLDPNLLLELLRMRNYSTGRTVKIVTEDQTIEGIFVDYQSLDAVVVDSKVERVIVPAASAILVEYPD